MDHIHEIYKYAHKQLKKAMAGIVPDLKEFKSFLLENEHLSRETSFDVGDMDIFCYLIEVCVHRYKEGSNEEFCKIFGIEGVTLSTDDDYDQFIIFEEDQNFAFAVRIKEDEEDDGYDLDVEVFCFSSHNPHPYFKPLNTLYESYESKSITPIYHLKKMVRKGKEEDYSGRIMHDVHYLAQIERFLNDLESSVLTMQDEI